MEKKKEKKSRVKGFISKHKVAIVISIIVVSLLLFLFGAKMILYVNFLLGNDVILGLDVDKEVLFLEKGQQEEVAFETKVTTNPFCKAICEYEFEDISKGVVLEEDNFSLIPEIPLEKEYIISEQNKGSGIELYRFYVECHSVKTFFCHTGEEVVTRSQLLTVKYDLSAENKKLKQKLKEDLNLAAESLSELKGKQGLFDSILAELKTKKVVPEFSAANNRLRSEVESNVMQLESLKDIWVAQEYLTLSSELKKLKLTELENESSEINNDILNLVYRYNSLVGEIDDLNNEVNNTIFANATDEYSEMVAEFNKESFIEDKENKVEQLKNVIKELKSNLTLNLNSSCLSCNFTGEICDDIRIANEFLNSTNASNISFEECSTANLTKLELSRITNNASYPIELGIVFEEPLPECCIFGKCESCCISEKCKDENYPIVFLHGHAVNKDLSAEYSLEGFNDIQKRLEQDGYLNAGAVTLYTLKDTPEGVWGMVNAPFAIRASYYFDIFQEPENYVVVQAKSESIDTYALRLGELIDTIKYKTGKDKVRIVAFSMGGLVARKYLQIYGAEDVDRLIMIGTPNHGIKGGIADYCPLIGESLECRDMDSNSLFINKLNRGKLPDILIYNIVGTGCDMEGQQGDGAVTEESARLDGAKNFVINGTCRSKLMPLHLDLRNIDLYPEVYTIIKQSLEE